ncbi:BRCT domain protein [Trichophyton verrucosum HKI 0517]|uniref:BRCT domain protein n=1 Tax=Trichophyton verrucosum (strain HKI 0517) TaxID=663202 RepID=D4DA86_TRIVH|nr:BRCT domain protein [Trichophyton verrucosum HKI 0517]EFE41237.1 BRCT domain protein [Trichophyton verrucosum HKI 0517]
MIRTYFPLPNPASDASAESNDFSILLGYPRHSATKLLPITFTSVPLQPIKAQLKLQIIPKAMGRTFKNITVSVTGEFGPISDKFKQWVEANGGSFSREVNSGVTHLLSTKGAFKANNNAVSSDWLEDSLLSKSRRPKREGPYLWSQLTKKARKTSSGQKKADKDVNTKQINGLYKTLFRGL